MKKQAIRCNCDHEAYYSYAENVKLLELVCGNCYKITYLVVLDGTPVFNYEGEIPQAKPVRPEYLYETCLDIYGEISNISMIDGFAGDTSFSQ